MSHIARRHGRLAAAALLLALSLSACQNAQTTPNDRSFRVPNWCEPHGCSWGGSGV